MSCQHQGLDHVRNLINFCSRESASQAAENNPAMDLINRIQVNDEEGRSRQRVLAFAARKYVPFPFLINSRQDMALGFSVSSKFFFFFKVSWLLDTSLVEYLTAHSKASSFKFLLLRYDPTFFFCVGMLVRLKEIQMIMMLYTTGHLFSRSLFSLYSQLLSLSLICDYLQMLKEKIIRAFSFISLYWIEIIMLDSPQESADNVSADSVSPSKDDLLEEACKKYDEATRLCPTLYDVCIRISVITMANTSVNKQNHDF